jgi:hypothetical protein
MPERLFQRPVEIPTAVTRKLLTGCSHLKDHRKAERVTSRNGIWDFQSFNQSESEN